VGAEQPPSHRRTEPTILLEQRGQEIPIIAASQRYCISRRPSCYPGYGLRAFSVYLCADDRNSKQGYQLNRSDGSTQSGPALRSQQHMDAVRPQFRFRQQPKLWGLMRLFAFLPTPVASQSGRVWIRKGILSHHPG